MADLLSPSAGSFCAYYAFIIHYSSLALIIVALLSTPAGHAHEEAAGDMSTSFVGMYAWGDSLTDTGNSLLYQLSINVDAPEGHLPYGQTFFHYPTGRISDGRVVVDFLAQHVKAPYFLLPYLALNGTQINGTSPFLVNFAVGGATAQNVDFLNATYNISVFIPYSLDKQLEWFSTLAISKNKETFSKSLVYFGEIGGNDYNRALENGFSIEDIIIKFVPAVIEVIQNALEFLIDSGAKYLVIEGAYPIGCTPVYTRSLYTNGTINQYGCVEELQRISEVHDKLLKGVIHNLTTKYGKDAQLIFFDQVKAYGEILKHPSHYGFINTIDPCFDVLNLLNLTTVETCSRPSTYLSWDGLHFTEATHSALFSLFNTEGFVTPYPNFLTSKSF